MKIYKQNNDGSWIETDKVINRNYIIDVTSLTEDIDLHGFMVREEPPIEYLTWLEENEPEIFIERGYNIPKPFSITYKNKDGNEETFEGSAEEVLEKMSEVEDFEITDNNKGKTLIAIGNIGGVIENPEIGKNDEEESPPEGGIGGIGGVVKTP